MNPSLYDLLDVDESASEQEIRDAWKAAIADLGPTDRRFRAYNQAAEVLLDPDKRAAYDAERAGSQPEPEPDEPEPDEAVALAVGADPEARPEGEPEPLPAEEPEGEEARGADDASWRSREPARWMVATVAAVALAVLVVTVVTWWSQHPWSDDESWADAAVDAAVETAPKALAYDHRTLDEDISAAQDLMTADQRARHNELIADLRDDIESQKAVVESNVVGSGLIRGSSERADVLVLVNQHTIKTDPQDNEQEVLIPLWVTFEMVHDDGEWLLDRMVNEGVVATSGDDGDGSERSPDGTASPTAPEASPTSGDGTGTATADGTDGGRE